jgi:Holliday junction resolvase RusA-like endonuclease
MNTIDYAAPASGTGTIVVELAGEPKGKGRPRFARSGVAYTPANTRRFEGALRYAAQEEMNGAAPLEGPLAVKVTAVFPIPTSWSKRKRQAALDGAVAHICKPDVDNLIKSIDSLNQVCWVDDKQVAAVIKLYGERSCTRIEIEPV